MCHVVNSPCSKRSVLKSDAVVYGAACARATEGAPRLLCHTGLLSLPLLLFLLPLMVVVLLLVVLMLAVDFIVAKPPVIFPHFPGVSLHPFYGDDLIHNIPHS